jgi:hypothetical protein
MKTKIIYFLTISAVVTLSFAFVSVHSNKKESKVVGEVVESSNEPAGGFISEDQL